MPITMLNAGGRKSIRQSLSIMSLHFSGEEKHVISSYSAVSTMMEAYKCTVGAQIRKLFTFHREFEGFPVKISFRTRF